jgi:hypothetical protein
MTIDFRFRGILVPTMSILLLTACSGARRPVLYPNDHCNVNRCLAERGYDVIGWQ